MTVWVFDERGRAWDSNRLAAILTHAVQTGELAPEECNMAVRQDVMVPRASGMARLAARRPLLAQRLIACRIPKWS